VAAAKATEQVLRWEAEDASPEGKKTSPLRGVSHARQARHNESQQARRWLPPLGKKRGQKATLQGNLIRERGLGGRGAEAETKGRLQEGMRWCRDGGDPWTWRKDRGREEGGQSAGLGVISSSKTVAGFVIQTGILSVSSAQLHSPK
jgi:hypothetical protein